jgi:hypothetical protein
MAPSDVDGRGIRGGFAVANLDARRRGAGRRLGRDFSRSAERIHVHLRARQLDANQAMLIFERGRVARQT